MRIYRRLWVEPQLPNSTTSLNTLAGTRFSILTFSERLSSARVAKAIRNVCGRCHRIEVYDHDKLRAVILGNAHDALSSRCFQCLGLIQHRHTGFGIAKAHRTEPQYKFVSGIPVPQRRTAKITSGRHWKDERRGRK